MYPQLPHTINTNLIGQNTRNEPANPFIGTLLYAKQTQFLHTKFAKTAYDIST